ncbi:MAG: hypothetical protein HQ495_00210, partial [Alphaproteobacteria bacterium]|nr:hypothetical protein [Alphaproteobacteria bacterium]
AAGCAADAAVQSVAVRPPQAAQATVRAPSPPLFDLATLVAERGGGLTDSARAHLNGALADLVTNGREGTSGVWRDAPSDSEGILRLSRFGALIGDGQTCALVQHEHRVAAGFVRGSIRLCKRDSEAWHLDDVVWRRTGGDLAEAPSGQRVA